MKSNFTVQFCGLSVKFRLESLLAVTKRQIHIINTHLCHICILTDSDIHIIRNYEVVHTCHKIHLDDLITSRKLLVCQFTPASQQVSWVTHLWRDLTSPLFMQISSYITGTNVRDVFYTERDILMYDMNVYLVWLLWPILCFCFVVHV